MRLSHLFAVLLILSVLLTGCATHYTGDAVKDPYGFFSGVWHGVIFIFSLIVNVISWVCSLAGISLFESIEIIGRPNSGFWYYVGFAIGMTSAGGSASR